MPNKAAIKRIGFLQLSQITIVFLFFVALSCGTKKPKKPLVSPVAELVDPNVLETEAMGVRWYSYVDDERKFRLKLPRAGKSDLVEKDGRMLFVGWLTPDTTAFKAGLLGHLADERGFLFQVYKRPYYSFGQDYFDFEELGADFYRTHANYKKRRLDNGQYITLQDSSISAFMFDTQIDFGSGLRTPNFLTADQLVDPVENTLQRTAARVIYVSHKRHNFRIIYEKGNPLAEGIFNSLIFF